MSTAPKRSGDLLLEVEGLEIDGRRDDRWQPIARGIDLKLRRGEVLGLIGESGAGKSSIGLAAMGFARPGCRLRARTLRFDGQDLAAMPEEAKRRLWGVRMAYVAQSAAAAYNPAHRLIDQFCEVPVQHGIMGAAEAERAAVALFARLHLPEPERIGQRYPHQVSGGQLQRVMTAMALGCRPDLIVFDEPTTALDVTTQIEVLAAIREAIAGSHTAALYISHDLAVVAQMADRVLVLRHGAMVEEAPTAEMLAHPKHPYTRSLWAVRTLHKPEQPAEAPLLRVTGLAAGYAGLQVLADVSLDVPRGRTVAVVGESGSGKSTLARVLTGLLPPWSGTVTFEGRPLPPALAARDAGLLRRIQMIYQSPDTALNPRRRVGDILGRPLRRHRGLSGGACRSRVAELLEMIELGPDFADRLPSELSGGQKQRVCIARALAMEPELVICDEVTSALDQVVAEGILRLLLRLQKQLGVSYLFITHDLATVRAIADWIVVMHRGRIVQQGPKSAVLNPPHHPYTALLLSSVPEMQVGWLDRVLAARAAGAP